MKLSNAALIRTGHAFRGKIEHVPDGAVKVIQPKNISDQGFVSFSATEPLRINVPSPRLLQPNDVLVVSRGRFLAAVFEAPDSQPWIASSSILVLSIKQFPLMPHYVAFFLNSPAGQRQFQRHCESTTVPYIKAKTLEEIEIPIPPIKRQESIIGLARTMAEYSRFSKQKKNLYQAILHKQFQS